MPIISRFYGITIRMYFQQSEHNPPHIHAVYGEDHAEISIISGEVLKGHIPLKALSLVKEWIEINRSELIEMWNDQEFRSIPPLV